MGMYPAFLDMSCVFNINIYAFKQVEMRFLHILAEIRDLTDAPK